MIGISAYGAYLPHWRLQRSAIADALGSGPGAGSRTVAGFDEDTTSLGVEAARLALAVPGAKAPDVLYFASTQPAYGEKSNATVVHAALGLAPTVGSFDFGSAARSAAGAIAAATDAVANGRTALVVFSDQRGGRPGGADERDGGDGAVAFLFGGEDDAIAERLGGATVSAEFLDAWRLPGDRHVSHWEERFTDTVYTPLVEQAIAAALADCDLTPEQVQHAVVSGPSQRIIRRAGAISPGDVSISESLLSAIGNAGVALGPLGLVAVLDEVEAGAVILQLSLADGVDASVWRATERLGGARAGRPSLAARLGAGVSIDYPSFLTWRGELERETPRRPDPERPAAPPSLRSADWKFALTAGRCGNCGARQLPPQPVCNSCHAVDAMAPERVVEVPATVRTFAVDRLAYSIAPPVVSAVIDFDGGGRLQCELTDLDPEALRVGDRVEMSFRRTHTAKGVHNYFWKGRPLSGGEEER